VTSYPPAQSHSGAAPLHSADDRALLADLLGPAAAGLVDDVPVATLLDAGAAQLTTYGLTAPARRRLLAAAELARRFQPISIQPASYGLPREFLPHLAELRSKPVEVLGVLPLNARLGLLDGFCPVACGHVMHLSVTAREVFAPAITRLAAAVVLVHNHPSGDPGPSPEDRAFTQLMVRTGELLGIQILDHLIVARRAYFSFAEARML
jgi:DNA repair protein RadC